MQTQYIGAPWLMQPAVPFLQVASGIDTLTLTGNHYKAGATLIMGADSVTHLTQSGNVGDL